MQIKHGLKSSFRMPGKSLLTFLLFFLVMALLGTSIGVTSSVSQTLKALSDSYTTIAVAEFVSEQEPDPETIITVTDQISGITLPSSIQKWEAEHLAQCYLGDLDDPVNYRATNSYGVLVIETRQPGVFSSRGTVNASVKQVLFSGKKVDGKSIEVYYPGIKEHTTYLAYGKWYRGTLGAEASLQLLTEPLELSSAESYEQTPGAQVYLELADQLRVRTNSAYLATPENLEQYFPFQQKSIQITKGRSFTSEELSGGERVCLLSTRLAGKLNCKVNDSIQLSVAVGNRCAILESYDPAAGFDLTASFRVVGLTNAKDAWENVIITPPQRELDLSRSIGTASLGQFVLVNDKADEFLAWADQNLPTGVRVTLYDQGYEEAARPIRVMLRTVRLIMAACAIAGVCFLLLNVWLFVARQKHVGTLNHRLGGSDVGICLYHLGAMAPILLPGLALGAWFSAAAGERISRRIANVLKRSEQADLRYSDAQLSLRQSVELVQKNASKRQYLIIALTVLVVSLALSVFFALRTIPKYRKRRRFGSLRTHTKTRSLNGGSIKYALLSSNRGGFRTVLTLAASLLAAILFCALSTTGVRTENQLLDLEQNATVRGYFTNIQGTSASGLLVKYEDAFLLGDLDLTVSMTSTVGGNDSSSYWDYVGKAVNWDSLYEEHIADIHVPELPTGEFLDIILQGERRKNGVRLVNANSMQDVTGLMYAGNQTVLWADNYSDRILRGWDYLFDYSTGLYGNLIQDDLDDTWEEEREKTRQALLTIAQPYYYTMELPCVVSKTFLSEHGLSLGDSFFLCQLSKVGGQESHIVALTMKCMKAVGVYSESSERNTIYCPMLDCLEIGPDGEQRRYQSAYGVGFVSGLSEEEIININEMWDRYKKNFKMESAVYRFRGTQLAELKQILEESGFTEVGYTGGARKPFVLEDQTYLATKRSVEQRLWYMQKTFPVVVVLAELLALILGCLQILSRRRDLWLMHLTGTGKGRAFFSIFLEQLYLCPIGAALGLLLCKYLGLLDQTGLVQTMLFAGLWLLACLITAATAVLRPKRTGKE